MRILFDQGTPAPLGRRLVGHDVATAFELGWSQISNGQLLAVAEAAEFDVLITTDQNLEHQQSLAGRRLAILVLSTTSWPRIEQRIDAVLAALGEIVPGSYVLVAI